MNKKSWIILVVIIILLIGTGIFFYFRNQNMTPSENTYEANRTSSNQHINQSEYGNVTENQTNTSVGTATQQEQQNNNSSTEITKGITEAETKPPVEEEIASFSTKIYSKDSARQNNISITCNTLNGTIVKNGETFSFCDTVGPASSSKGYQKADIFDKYGNKKKGLGGRKLSN